MIYNLVPPNDRVLFSKSIDFDFSSPPIDPQELFENMRETLMQFRGYGLSCNQVGLPYNMFVMGDSSQKTEMVGIFNPKIVARDGGKTKMDEGCLSYPNLVVPVKRHDTIRLRYTTFNGVTDTRVFKGLTSRIVQHEFDHLNGVVHFQHISKFKLKRILELGNKKGLYNYHYADFHKRIDEYIQNSLKNESL